MSRFRLQSDQALLAAFPTDPSAFDAFYDRYEGPLLAFLVRLTRDSEVAADLMSEVFAALIVELAADRPVAEPRGWLYAVARRKVIDSARRGKVEAAAREQLGVEPIALTDASLERIDELADDESLVARAAFEQLPDEQRQAVEVRVIDGLSYAEAATRLECSEAVVRKRVSRGLSRLRSSLVGEAS